VILNAAGQSVLAVPELSSCEESLALVLGLTMDIRGQAGNMRGQLADIPRSAMDVPC
jgi:hypothetical protein